MKKRRKLGSMVGFYEINKEELEFESKKNIMKF